MKLTSYDDTRIQLDIDHETVEVSKLTARITLLWNRLYKADQTAALDLADWLPTTRLVPPGFHTRTGQQARKGPL